MKKILAFIVALFLMFGLTGCDEKVKDTENKQNNVTKQEEKKEDIKTETKTETKTDLNDTIVDDDEIIDVDEEDNTPHVEDKTVVEKIINCGGCVFAYFSAEGDSAKRLGSTLTSGEYTTDINDLRTMGKKQRHNFFGLVLSGGKISKAYACIYKDKKIYCIQGGDDGAHHTSNISILNQIFTANECKTISAGHTYTCTDGHYNGDTKTNGYASLHYETSCVIYGSDSGNSGKLICH